MTDLARHLDGASTSVALANHATHGAPLAVTDAYDVVGALDELLRRLPQLVGFLVRSTKRADPTDYFDDLGRHPAGAIADAGHALALVVADLDAAGAHATTAHNHLGHLGRLTTED
ncbi:hypothetical protein Acsp06_28010 [Actinomycetospora sp. NBRC 106375]|uniref:hypothetical protein n=1 Tax=Actinomycetospora sp. NBRC 106375 TaxID=3032207 RepID=UPI0024A25086|nr:hypothetical protein [Actinomycetospora sp. NBRC 106375]GLZ46616.1 hypothetical protein Acsp06_28010 [Actinomycetospora sp. NBRC 106375]